MKKFWERYCALTRAKQIAIAVFLFHALAIFSLCIHHLATWKRPPKQKIAVRTVRAASAAAPAPRAAPKGEIQAAPKKEAKPAAKKAAPAKKSSSKPVAAAPKKEKPAIQKADESLLKEIAENLEILSASETPQKKQSRPALTLPGAVPKAVQIETAAVDVGYGEALAAYLQSALELPEYGEVRAELKISRSGELIGLKILDSRNRKNEEFLKKRLQELPFPCLNDFGISDESFTATISFKNVENP